VRPALVEKYGYKNPHQVPRLEKITLNMGVGAAISDKKLLDVAASALGEITGQKPVITLARTSIAGFKLREGMPIGCMVTLRRQRMYEFMDRLVSIVLPRVRDFRGISRKAFDGRGNYSMGLAEQLVFPELNPDKYTKPQGMNIVFVTSAINNDEGRDLLDMMGMPFRAAPQKSGAA
jgi:large subunit ribosomal protein L5